MSINTLEEKFAYELSSVYDAEHRILDGLQEMLVRASDDRFCGLLETHVAETQQQIRNLEQVFQHLSLPPEQVMCAAAAGLITDAWKAMQEAGDNRQLVDSVLVAAMAKVEHFEMAAYRGLATGAQLMGRHDVHGLLQENLQQEERTARLVEEMSTALLQQALQSQPVGG